MKKVLVIAPYAYLPYYSGGQKFIAQFMEALASQTELTVVSVNANDPQLARGYRILPLLKKGFSRYLDIGLARKITRIVRAEHFDAIIWEHPYLNWVAVQVKNATGISSIIHTHNIEYQRFRSIGKWWWPILQRYEKWAFKCADKLLFITPEDMQFAIQQWGTDPAKCLELPFGVTISQHPADRAEKRELICRQHGIQPGEKILLFNGMLQYGPNLDALNNILHNINPLLKTNTGFRYKIIICGKGLPENYKDLEAFRNDNVIYAGFVDHIDEYFKAADVFLNPVQSGGGIKTKMVEAIAYGCSVISTQEGAKGIDIAASAGKLQIVQNNDWRAYAQAVVETSSVSHPTPDSFYLKYNWESIIEKLMKHL